MGCWCLRITWSHWWLKLGATETTGYKNKGHWSWWQRKGGRRPRCRWWEAAVRMAYWAKDMEIGWGCGQTADCCNNSQFPVYEDLRQRNCLQDIHPWMKTSMQLSLDHSPPPIFPLSSVLGAFLSLDELMETITKEYNRQVLNKGGWKEENVAFYAGDNGGKGKKTSFQRKCFNCSKKGHKKPDCWQEGGGKAGQGPKQK